MLTSGAQSFFGFVVIVYYIQLVSSQTECGVFSTIITNGKSLPWSANIYRLNASGAHEFHCFGSIISRSVILTAAHCFYDDVKQQRKLGRYFVTIGQQYPKWSQALNKQEQKRELSSGDIILPNKYGLATKYSSNIAILKLTGDKKLNLNNSTKSVCIDWFNEFTETTVEVNLPPLKIVTLSKNGTFTTLELRHIIYEKCYDLLPEQSQEFLTFDKMCGEVNGSLKSPITGTGLYGFNKNGNLWYLLGIATGFNIVNNKTVLTFTKISSHLNWLNSNASLLLHSR